MSLLFATWAGSCATVVLAIGAIITVIYAVRAFREQSEEVRLLQEQTQRDIEQRRRDQASKVFVSVEPRPFDGDPADMRDAACLHNTSPQPIYDIVLGLGETGDQSRPVLLPGNQFVLPGLGTAFTDEVHEVWATFRDSAGVWWRTAADGQLAEQAMPSTVTSDAAPSTVVSPKPPLPKPRRVRLRLVVTVAVLLLAAGSGAITATVLTAHSATDSRDLLGHMACSLAQQAVVNPNPNGPTNGSVTDIYQAAPKSANADIRRAGQAFRAEVDRISASPAESESHFDPTDVQAAIQTFWDVCINNGYVSG